MPSGSSMPTALDDLRSRRIERRQASPIGLTRAVPDRARARAAETGEGPSILFQCPR